jgi:peptidoglycan/LPS O-acetylase OafA/YrhL
LTVAHSQSKRNRQFDLFRIIFATMVLLGHAPELTDGDRSRELFNKLTRSGMSFGDVGVIGFFLLSGYLIVQSWQGDPEFLNYLRKRLLRIVPGYMVAAILSTLIVGLLAPAVPSFFQHLGYHFPVTLLRLDSPKTPPVFPGFHYQDVNGSLWTIPYELRCYLLVAVFGVCGLFRRPLIWICATVFFLVVISSNWLEHRLSWGPLQGFTGYPPHVFHLTATFLVGGCFYLLRDRIVFRPAFAIPAAIILLLADAFAPSFLEVPLILMGGYLLFYIAKAPMESLANLKRFPDVSYGIYLYGWPVEALLIWYHRGSPWVTFVVSVPICFALGWLSWHFVERPMLKLKRRATAPLPAP